MASMNELAPAILREMPAIMQKLKASTAHLPPPPKKGADEDTLSADSQSWSVQARSSL